MPLYEFICERCDRRVEFVQSILDPLPISCGGCSSTAPDFHQVYGGNVIMLAYNNPTTIGQQAEINAKRVGKAKLEEMAHNNRTRTQKHTGKLPPGAKRLPPSGNELPWFRSGETAGLPKREKPINLDKIPNKQKFIETGDV